MDAVVFPKRWYSSASTHGIRNKKVIIKIFTAMRTVNIIIVIIIIIIIIYFFCAGFIGWRSAVEECSLERVGPLYVSPKLTIEHPEDYPPSKQINIFIG
jgi:hypothetical protein